MIDVLNESKYTVNGYKEYDLGDSDISTFQLDTPENAVKAFCKVSAMFPMEAEIIAKTKEDACELVDWCIENEDKFIDIMKNTNRFPYRIDYMVNSVKEQASNRCRGFVGFENFGDAVDPFTVG